MASIASSTTQVLHTRRSLVRETPLLAKPKLHAVRLFDSRGKCNAPFPRSLPLKCNASADTTPKIAESKNERGLGFSGLHHVGILCKDIEKSLDFYCGILGLEVNDARDDARLSFGGKWLWIGSDMIHLMELPNPDPTNGRPAYVGRDRHTCIRVNSVPELQRVLDEAGVEYTMSKSGRPAIFTRDPDGNGLEFVEK